MTVRVKDIDGSREVEFEIQGGTAFWQAPGFCYEFDLGILWHAWKKEIAHSMGVATGSIPVMYVDSALGVGLTRGDNAMGEAELV